MRIQVRRADHADVEAMRELNRQELDCQIVHYSFLSRGLADAFLVLVDDRIGGYGAVANKYGKGRVIEFYSLPAERSLVFPMFRELLIASQATHIEAQTNMPLMMLVLFDFAINIIPEKVIFQDRFASHLTCPNGTFRKCNPSDTVFRHQIEPPGDWVVEVNGTVVATGGFMCHYNPPYADIYMEVAEAARRQGFGSYLVQELKRVCYETSKKPAARCDPTNFTSRRALEKAGLLPCGHLVVGEVKALE